jgi:hypothetical protein
VQNLWKFARNYFVWYDRREFIHNNNIMGEKFTGENSIPKNLESITDILKREEKEGRLIRWPYKWEQWETIKWPAKKWEKWKTIPLVETSQDQRDAKTERIIAEMTDKFSTLGVTLTWEKNVQGKYEISLSKDKTWVNIKIQIPETESEGVKLSTEDFLNILYTGIESKGNAFKNQETDLMTKWVRALAWNEEDYKKLPFSITLQNGQKITFWMGKYTTEADKKRGEELIKYGRSLEDICKKLSS